MLLLAALQLNILKRAKNHHFLNTEINNRVGDGTRVYTQTLKMRIYARIYAACFCIRIRLIPSSLVLRT